MRKTPKPAPRGGLTLEVFRAANRSPGVHLCTLSAFVRTLSAADQEAVREAFADPTIQAAAITSTLNDCGFRGGRSIVQRHRREGCTKCDFGGRA
jgi:hypothetical protein